MYQIGVKVSEAVLMNLLITAIEGGSNYWMRVRSSELTTKKDGYVSATIEDIEAEESKTYQITIENILTGLQRLADRMTKPGTEDWHFKPSSAARVLADAIGGSGDASTADIVLQMGVLGEVVYG